jgi:zinc finger-containing ubiquitin peptidase 1
MCGSRAERAERAAGTPTAALVEALASKCGWQRLVKRGIHTLRKAEYQLMYVEDGIASGEQREALRVIAAAERFRC